jgi:predicted transcriptional regulator
MATLSELTVQVLTARLAKRDMSLEELQKEMITISAMLKGIDAGIIQEPAAEAPVEPETAKIDFRKIFKKDEVICLVCTKGYKTLKRHLKMVHQLTDKEYRIKFGIDPKQVLVAKSYSEQKKAYALEHKLGEKMQAGRKAKGEDVTVPVNVVPEIDEKKASVSSVRKKPSAPAVNVPVKSPKATPETEK